MEGLSDRGSIPLRSTEDAMCLARGAWYFFVRDIVSYELTLAFYFSIMKV